MCNIDALKFYKKNDIYCHKRLINYQHFLDLAEFFGSAGKNLRNVEISLCRDRQTIRPHIIFCILLKFLAQYGIVNTIICTSKHINQIEDYVCNCRYMTSVLYV